MALSNYTELQAAIRTELDFSTGGIADAAIVDAIKRCESKVNRRTKLREAEQLSFATLTSSSRYLAVPVNMLELLNLRIKLASEADTEYDEVTYVGPERLHEYYSTGSDSGEWYYTLRDQLEFCRVPVSDHTVMMHYIKMWSIATDSTNWLLTNFPDVYLYGSLMECEAHLKNDARMPIWKSLFDEGMADLNSLDNKGRDDAILDTNEVANLASRNTFNILVDG